MCPGRPERAGPLVWVLGALVVGSCARPEPVRSDSALLLEGPVASAVRSPRANEIQRLEGSSSAGPISEFALHDPRPALRPPSKPGAVASSVRGCLASTPKASGAEKSMPALSAGSDRPTTVKIAPVVGGIEIEHSLEHACCLRAEVSARVEENRAVVRETLIGDPCLCMCRSTIRSAVGLAPGAYSFRLELAQGRRTTQVVEQAVTVL